METTKETREKILDFIFDMEEWKIFFKRLFSILAVVAVSLLLWIFPISLIVAPFYSVTQDKTPKIEIYNDLTGKTTTKAIEKGLQDLLDEGLVTNFIGVRIWIDNKYYEQVGKIEMYRIALNLLENNLARNRGTGGANPYIVQARSDVYADYTLPMFTSYSTRLKQAISNIENYLKELKEDKDKPMERKRAVFIVNSDNLSVALDKLKQQLQTNLMLKSGFMSEDDKFYRIKGNLIAMYYVLKGIDYDFRDKMRDKTSYSENFLPIMSLLKEAISQNHLVIMESMGHLSKLEKDANLIAQKLAELRDKLRNG